MADERPPYVHQPYPKMKYHKTKAPRTVKDDDEERTLGVGWEDTPAKFEAGEEEPEPAKVILSDIPKLNGDADTLIVPAKPGTNDTPAEPLGDVIDPATGKKKK